MTIEGCGGSGLDSANWDSVNFPIQFDGNSDLASCQIAKSLVEADRSLKVGKGLLICSGNRREIGTRGAIVKAGNWE